MSSLEDLLLSFTRYYKISPSYRKILAYMILKITKYD